MPKNFPRRRLTAASFPMPDPGESLKLVADNPWGGANTTLETRLWEIRKGHLLLQQTEPPMGKDDIGNNLQLSYLVTFFTGEPVRVGFNAPLRTIVDLPNNRGQILVVPVPQRIRPMSLRAFSRITPGNVIKLSASLQLEGLSLPMNAIGDLSLGGARLLHKGGLPLSEGQRMRLSLATSEETMLLPATLLRQEQVAEFSQASLVIRFVDLNEQEKGFLKTILNRIWKRQLSINLSQLAEKTIASNQGAFIKGAD